MCPNVYIYSNFSYKRILLPKVYTKHFQNTYLRLLLRFFYFFFLLRMTTLLQKGFLVPHHTMYGNFGNRANFRTFNIHIFLLLKTCSNNQSTSDHCSIKDINYKF